MVSARCIGAINTIVRRCAARTAKASTGNLLSATDFVLLDPTECAQEDEFDDSY